MILHKVRPVPTDHAGDSQVAMFAGCALLILSGAATSGCATTSPVEPARELPSGRSVTDAAAEATREAEDNVVLYDTSFSGDSAPTAPEQSGDSQAPRYQLEFDWIRRDDSGHEDAWTIEVEVRKSTTDEN